MRVRELLQHLDGAGLTITDWEELKPALAEVGLTLASSLNEAQWTEVETIEKRAVRILTEAGLDAHLHHSGGGIWVAEVSSPTIPGRQVWVTDSEDDQRGPFLVGVYPSPGSEGWFEALSGPCTEAELVDRVHRGLTEPA